jgi:diguanylate cyclase (GGDEF)-like protein
MDGRRARIPYNPAMAPSTPGGDDETSATTQPTSLTRAGDGELRAAYVVVVHGEGLGTRAMIGEAPMVIGRGPEAQLRIDHGSVSRRHCELWRDGDVYRVRDLGSTNRTLVNERAVGEARLQDGDLIVVGKSMLKFISRASVEARFQDALYELATHDALTGLANRRHFLAFADAEVARARQLGGPLALAILDLDHFKVVNDRHGHARGDDVLRHFAVLLKNAAGDTSLAARLGGEEFAWLLPATPANDALARCEALRLQVRDLLRAMPEAATPVTVSIGLALLGGRHVDRTTLMAAADGALYAAKTGGRDQVRLAES